MYLSKARKADLPEDFQRTPWTGGLRSASEAIKKHLLVKCSIFRGAESVCDVSSSGRKPCARGLLCEPLTMPAIVATSGGAVLAPGRGKRVVTLCKCVPCTDQISMSALTRRQI